MYNKMTKGFTNNNMRGLTNFRVAVSSLRLFIDVTKAINSNNKSIKFVNFNNHIYKLSTKLVFNLFKNFFYNYNRELIDEISKLYKNYKRAHLNINISLKDASLLIISLTVLNETLKKVDSSYIRNSLEYKQLKNVIQGVSQILNDGTK